jgi:YesN/AraC family two-component response regulator
VLLDIYMQQENGLDLLPGLRELGEKTDVIIISSASDVNTVQKALHYGVVDYLIKPFQFSRFKEALSHYRQQSQLLAQREFSQADVDSLLRRQPGGQDSSTTANFPPTTWPTPSAFRGCPAASTSSIWRRAAFSAPVFCTAPLADRSICIS